MAKKYESPQLKKVELKPKNATLGSCGTPSEMAARPWHPCKSVKE